ncbi:MAG: hypothetical protein JSS81_21200 [Acidobacteria bacterium]|nr:hypothetical protein [Acidobacteriota bacterium]
MKNIINAFIYGKNSLAGGLVALAVVLAIGTGCFCNKDKINELTNKSGSSPSPAASSSPSASATPSYKKADASKNEIPSNDEMQDIVKKTMLDFNDALQSGDFTDFHKTVAKKWQDQITPEKFKEGFSVFVNNKTNISNIKNEKAEFTSGPKIDRSRGLRELVVEGKYNTSPLPAKFKLQYISEGKDWKLYGIELDTRKD